MVMRWSNLSIPRKDAIALWTSDYEALQAAQDTLRGRLALFDRKLEPIRKLLRAVERRERLKLSIQALRYLIEYESKNCAQIDEVKLQLYRDSIQIQQAEVESLEREVPPDADEEHLQTEASVLANRRDALELKSRRILNAKHLDDVRRYFHY